MKLKCLNCKALFQLIKIKDKEIEEGDTKALIRCPLCIDMLAYHPIKMPVTGDEKDDARYRHLIEYLGPRTSLCGQTDADAKLKCSVCKIAEADRPNPAYCKIAIQADNMVVKWVEKKQLEDAAKPLVYDDLQDPVDPSAPMKYDSTSMHGQEMWTPDDD